MRSIVLASLVSLAAVLGGCVVAAAPAHPAEAHAMRNGFAFLGERMVNGGVDHDVIHVGRADGRFHELMIVVERAPIELFDMVVTFGNNERWEAHTRLVFGPDSTSRNIDLPGGARIIKRVDFRYGNLVAGAQAKVELWGR
ncbi:MAG: hypothetical protein E6J90_49780 [Deltaproteobacteria bacterium]|nr:MAG: hypothetical protein E6J90_49780 [Deltaproteobacteria bacterium]TMQ20679.1 MAG: hypothetical protein E6J91_03410 [Deltaproteobacteria bacterium]